MSKHLTNGYTGEHMYYVNVKANEVKPPWFINCSRQEAEDFLKRYQSYGNVLIRPSQNTKGSYALSSAAMVNNEMKFVHYVISRSTNGFTLEIHRKPDPMRCLEDVLNYYISAAGSHKHHAMVLDPKAKEPVGQHNPDDYINMPKTAPVKGPSNGRYEETYLPMNGNTGLKRRSSEPVTRDYINVPKTGAGRCVSELLGSQIGAKPNIGVANVRDYVNVNNTGHRENGDRVGVNVHKAASFPVYGGEDDDGDYLQPADPSYLELTGGDTYYMGPSPPSSKR